MMKRAWLAAAIVAMVWGCGGDNNGCPTGTICVDSGPGDVDAGPGDSDAGMADSGGPVPDGGPCALVPGRASGAACSRDRCTGGLACQTEIAANYAGTVNTDGTAGPAAGNEAPAPVLLRCRSPASAALVPATAQTVAATAHASTLRRI